MKKVKATVTYDCGRCGNVVRKKYESDDDGLMYIPNVYCGKCIGRRHFTIMSAVISGEEAFETADEPTEEAGHSGRVPENASGPAAETPTRTEEGRIDGDETDIKHPEPPSGIGSSGGMPPIPEKSRMDGRPSK